LLQIIEALPNVPSPDLAFRLYLQCAEVKLRTCLFSMHLLGKMLTDLSYFIRLRISVMKNQLHTNFSPRHTSYTKKKFRLVMFSRTFICLVSKPKQVGEFNSLSCVKNLPFEQDSKAQVTALQLIIGTLQRMQVFGVENRDTLTHKATGVFHHDMIISLLPYSIVSA